MSLLPKSIHRCRRYPTKFNSGRDIPVLDPTATEGYTAIGARSLTQLIADYWGRNLGIGMVLLGALALVGLHQSE